MNSYAKCAAAFIFTCIAGIATAQVTPPLQTEPTGPAALQPASSPVAVAPSNGPSDTTHALTAEDLSTFFDGLMPFALERGDVAGGQGRQGAIC